MFGRERGGPVASRKLYSDGSFLLLLYFCYFLKFLMQITQILIGRAKTRILVSSTIIQ